MNLSLRQAALLTTLALVAPLAAGCSSDAPTRRHDDTPAAGGSSAAGDAGAGAAPTVCQKSATDCSVTVIDGPPSGAACLAMRDNEGSEHVQLRQTWTRITAPVGNTIDLVYGTLRLRGEVPLAECNMRGVSGYIKLLDWDRSDPDPAKQTARIGWANYEGDGQAAAREGLCFVELSYSAPALGLTDPWLVKPVVQRRVAAEFDVADVRGTLPEGEGIFYVDEAAGVSHHYSPLEHIAIFDNAAKVTVVPIHDAEMRVRFNDPTLNCAGEYRAGSLDRAAGCDSKAQDDPTWGCSAGDGACPPGEGPVVTTGYFLIEELEKIYSTVLDSTLCVSYPGQQNSIDQGWADPGSWGLKCSGSPKWDPADPVNGLPMGDYCTATHGDATPECHDAYRSRSFGAMAAFPVKAASCPSTAVAASKATK